MHPRVAPGNARRHPGHLSRSAATAPGGRDKVPIAPATGGAQFGDTYRDYQRRVPMLLPWRRAKAGDIAAAALRERRMGA